MQIQFNTLLLSFKVLKLSLSSLLLLLFYDEQQLLSLWLY